MSKKTTNSDGHLTQGQFLKSLLGIKDQKRVDQLISEYVDASHDTKTGGAMQKAALKAAELHIAIEKLQEEERKKEKQRDNTDQIKEGAVPDNMKKCYKDGYEEEQIKQVNSG